MSIFSQLDTFRKSLKSESKVAEVLEQALHCLMSSDVKYVLLRQFKSCPLVLQDCTLVQAERYAEPDVKKFFLQKNPIEIGSGGSGTLTAAFEVDVKQMLRPKPHPFGGPNFEWQSPYGLMSACTFNIMFDKVYKRKDAEFAKEDTLAAYQKLGYPPNYAALERFSGAAAFWVRVINPQKPDKIYHSFFTPYFFGKPLNLCIKDGDLKQFRDFLAVAVKICFSVLLAHCDGVIMRDIKPHNILLGAELKIRFIDQESARCQGASPEGDAENLTPLYAAPELVIQGRRLKSVTSASNGIVMQSTDEKLSQEQGRFWLDMYDHFPILPKNFGSLSSFLMTLTNMAVTEESHAVNFKADIYSLGMTLTHLYFGNRFLETANNDALRQGITIYMLEIEKKQLLNKIHLDAIEKLKDSGLPAKTFGIRAVWLGLLQKMLCFDPKDRLSIMEVFHNLMNLYFQETDSICSNLSPNFLEPIPISPSGLSPLEVIHLR